MKLIVVLFLLFSLQGFAQEYIFNSYKEGGAEWLMDTKITFDLESDTIAIEQEGSLRSFRIYEESSNEDFNVYKCKAWYLLSDGTAHDYAEKQDILQFTEMWLSLDGAIFIYKGENYGTDRPYTLYLNKKF